MRLLPRMSITAALSRPNREMHGGTIVDYRHDGEVIGRQWPPTVTHAYKLAWKRSREAAQ